MLAGTDVWVARAIARDGQNRPALLAERSLAHAQ
jgi:hypothetical protein